MLSLVQVQKLRYGVGTSMTSVVKENTVMPKTAQSYIDEIYTSLGKKFPLVVRVDGMGNMIYCAYETTWKTGEVSKTQTNDSLTAAQITQVNTWRDGYMGV